jgi:hypothetical protein
MEYVPNNFHINISSTTLLGNSKDSTQLKDVLLVM